MMEHYVLSTLQLIDLYVGGKVGHYVLSFLQLIDWLVEDGT